MVELGAAGFVPIALVHCGPFLPAVAGDAAVGEEIGRARAKMAAEAAIGMFGGDGIEEFKGVAVVKADEGGIGGEK